MTQALEIFFRIKKTESDEFDGISLQISKVKHIAGKDM